MSGKLFIYDMKQSGRELWSEYNRLKIEDSKAAGAYWRSHKDELISSGNRMIQTGQLLNSLPTKQTDIAEYFNSLVNRCSELGISSEIEQKNRKLMLITTAVEQLENRILGVSSKSTPNKITTASGARNTPKTEIVPKAVVIFSISTTQQRSDRLKQYKSSLRSK